jgi:acetyl esterase/lipase
VVARFGIDPSRIVLGGHSMGGFAAAAHARRDAGLLGVLLLDAWNVGLEGDSLAKVSGAALAARAAKDFDDLGNSLQGATPTGIAREIVAHRSEWNLRSWAPRLTHRPLLVIGAAKANGDENHAIAEAVRSAGGEVASITFDSDHAFQDHRIALAAEVVDWLRTLRAP